MRLCIASSRAWLFRSPIPVLPITGHFPSAVHTQVRGLEDLGKEGIARWAGRPEPDFVHAGHEKASASPHGDWPATGYMRRDRRRIYVSRSSPRSGSFSWPSRCYATNRSATAQGAYQIASCEIGQDPLTGNPEDDNDG